MGTNLKRKERIEELRRAYDNARDAAQIMFEQADGSRFAEAQVLYEDAERIEYAAFDALDEAIAEAQAEDALSDWRKFDDAARVRHSLESARSFADVATIVSAYADRYEVDPGDALDVISRGGVA